MVKGLIDSQSMSFWLFSTLLLWFKELGFVHLDAALFEQLVQSLSLSLVNVTSVFANVATFFQAKCREGGTQPFPFTCRYPLLEGFGWFFFFWDSSF